jgi:hypothetical protein
MPLLAIRYAQRRQLGDAGSALQVVLLFFFVLPLLLQLQVLVP